jgi:hypothetical protein
VVRSAHDAGTTAAVAATVALALGAAAVAAAAVIFFTAPRARGAARLAGGRGLAVTW